MKMKRNNKGFTLAELLIVVAIVIVLAAVAFLAVPRYQRSMTRLEFDTIAKEIFIAAQNHLTTAESQGYLQLEESKLGRQGTSALDTKGEHFFVYPSDSYHKDPKDQTALDLMLPFGAIDETVRAGGSYIIRYQPSSGRVLDVFYSKPGKSSLLTVTGKELTTGDYTTLMGSAPNYRKDGERNRQNYPGGVVGWYGGGDSLPVGARLNDPEVIVHNEEVLWVEVSDKNSAVTNSSLKLIITGEVSGAQKSFTLRQTISDTARVTQVGTTYKVILDDITNGNLHFASLTPDDDTKTFIPGENLTVEAVAFNNTSLSNVAYSGKKITNSLFVGFETKGEGSSTEHIAQIGNLRHFENLDVKISNYKYNGIFKKQDGTFESVKKAVQVRNMNWTNGASEKPAQKTDTFIEAVWFITGTRPTSVYDKDKTAVTTGSCFYPVSPTYELSYDGKTNDAQNHSISNIKVNYSGNAGLFGSLTVSGSAVSNLELIDFDITGTTNAGALAGTVTGTSNAAITISNVVAHNSAARETARASATKKQDVTTTGTAGGLIGSLNGCTVEKCAAALVVNGSTYAGGLIGTADGAADVVGCHAGGHTKNGSYSEWLSNATPTVPTDDMPYDVTSSGTAGGLIGAAGADTGITNSYSTCSVTGTKAGGFVGTSDGTISNCYCTGLVYGTGALEKVTIDGKSKYIPPDGAFAYSVNTVTNCKYFEIINERHSIDESNPPQTTSGYYYLTALHGNGTNAQITPFDASAATYQAFSGAPSGWQSAYPYDSKLTEYYGTGTGTSRVSKYNLKTAKQLDTSLVSGTDFVTAHYGDWPAPELFVINN